MTHLRLLATALFVTAALPAAAAPEPQPVDVGAVEEGQLSIDEASIKTRGGRRAGWKQVEATVQLAQPVFHAAREITQEVQTQDWDCDEAKYRVILRVFRTADGGFVRSERGREPWIPVPKEGPERAAFERICPSEAEAEG